ncbi:hypothetical protein ABPG72_017681 [Tetrahymena utriculariae]
MFQQIEFYVLIFAYDLTNSLLTQIDNILTLDSFFVIDSSNTIVVSTCFNSNSYVIFKRVSRQNYLLLSQKLIPGQVDCLQIMQSRQYNQIVFSPPKTLLGSSIVQFLFNIQNNMQATQKLLKASYENQLATVQSNQIVLYPSQSLIGQYVFSPTNVYLPDINMQLSFYQLTNQAEVIAIYFASAIFTYLNIKEYLNRSLSESKFQIKSNTTLIDSFISANQNREVLLQKRSDYKIQKINLTLIEDDSQLKCQAVIKSRNAILIRTTSQSQSYLYLFNYYTYSVNQLQFQDSSYFQSELGLQQLIAQDNYIIIFLQFYFTLIEANDNSQYRTINYQKYTPQFSKYQNWQYIYYDSFANLMIQYSLLQQVFQVFDFNQNLTCWQFFSSSVQSYHALQDRIQQVGQYIIAQSQKQYLVVFYIYNKQGLQNVTHIFQYNGSESNNVLDFNVIQYSNSYTFVIAISLSLQVFNMQTNQFICNLPTACQSRLQIKQDEEYFYIICSFQVSVFQKRVLKLVNYYKVNQFKFSNVKDIILVYQDMFLVFLQQGMHFIQPNKQQSNLLESFQNFFNPRVYQIQFAYSDQQQQTLSEIMNISNSNLIQIQKFYDVFTQETIIEYSFSMQQGQKEFANIINNNFVLPLFYQLSFQTISLQLALNQSDFNLNPYSNLKTVKFSHVEFIFKGNQNSPLLINNLNLLILDQMIIQNQLLNQLHSNIKIANLATVLIINMTIQNIQVLNQPLFIFQSVNKIAFQNLTLEGVSLNSTLFQFIECQNIQIYDTSVNNLKILEGNIIQVIQNNLIQVFNFNASQIYQVAQLQRITNLQDQQRILQNQLIEVPSILNLKGCQIVSIQNVNLYNIQDVSFVQVNNYSIGYYLQYFINQISIQNINVQELDYSKHGNYIFSITSIDANLINFKFLNVTSSNSLISLNVQLQVLIQDSQFEEVNLLTGSLFSVQQFQLNQNQQQFTNINCSGLPCALNAISANLVSIQNSIFMNLNNKENNQSKNNQLANYKGGAIKILSTNSTIINNSLFYNCSSLEEGGAIYIQQQQQAIFIIQMSNFTENESKKNSGGALYLSELSQVNISRGKIVNAQSKDIKISLSFSFLS